MTIIKLPAEPERGTTVRIVSSNSWNGRTYQRRATDDRQGRDAWFGVGHRGVDTWLYLLHRAGLDGHLEVVALAAEVTKVEPVDEWNRELPTIRNAERAAEVSR